jgi:formylglycine-generating enzyme required for sulfatase activity
MTPSTFSFNTQTVNPEGQPLSSEQLSTQGYSENLGTNITLTLIQIPGGSFEMGTPRAESGWHPSQHPLHLVTIQAYWIGQYPVTQAQWRAVAELPQVKLALTPQPACFKGDRRPVEQVSWFEAVEFCQRLTQQTGRSYRLPSEAEWEYACRAETTTPFHFGETITTDLANYSGINWEFNGKICSKGAYGRGPLGVDRRETTEVGSFGIANRFGLYDLHGQVREWCQDSWHDSYEAAPNDGAAWEDAAPELRVLRGGCWNGSPKSCRSGFRGRLDPQSQLYDVGFRVVCGNV